MNKLNHLCLIYGPAGGLVDEIKIHWKTFDLYLRLFDIMREIYVNTLHDMG